MIGPLDPFALEFDSITPDPALAPRTLDDPFLHIPLEGAARAERNPSGAGFYLLDSAEGRFVIDHDTGIISLVNEDILAIERGNVHGARVRVVEPSGVSYELNLKLCLNGRVPQMAGAEDFADLTALTPIPDLEAPPAAVAFSQFEACRGVALDVAELGAEDALFGALLDWPMPRLPLGAAALMLDAAPPSPASRFADWSL
ncbi:MAG: hypothetical protein ABUL55_01855 [Pseudomonadota bacterium]